VNNDRSRYNGCHMKYGTILPGAASLSRIKSISKEAQRRLEYLDWYRSHGNNAELTCRHFGISKSVFYRWKNRFNSKNLLALESNSTKPLNTRKETIDPAIVSKILELKSKYPRWGKAKIYPGTCKRQSNHPSIRVLCR